MGRLHILVGRSGQGKTQEMLGRLCGKATESPQILLTPDQASHEMERKLCQMGGPGISLQAQVLTFSRMTQQVFFHCGGLDDPELDGGGRVLLLHRSVEEARDRLRILGKYAQYPSFYEKLLGTVDELKACCVTAEDLGQLEPDCDQYDKIQEIALIYGLYQGHTQEIAFDPRDRLSRMADKLSLSNWGCGKEFWLDGFTDFTPQQQRVLKPLLRQGLGVTVVLTGDLGENEIFRPTQQTMEQLKRLASQEGARVTVEEFVPAHVPGRPGALAFLEANLFVPEGGEEAEPYLEDSREELGIFSALSPRSEVEWVASEIRRMVREEGYRFRDVTVVARNFGPYRHLIASLFPRYEIPVFVTQMSQILEKPVLSVVTSAMMACTRGYRYEEMFRYLKSGFSQVAQEKLDLLENYVLQWKIRGKQWKSPWIWPVMGPNAPETPQSQEVLAQLNLLREKIIGPLEGLLDRGREASGQGQCENLYRFLEEIDLYAQIHQRSDRWMARGQRAQGEEYLQLWDILCQGLEQCHQLLGEETLGLEEFCKTFGLVLSQYQVGTIPVSLDQVVAGEMLRLKNHRSPLVFWLGADDGSLPMVTESGGLFTDEDRLALEGANITLNQRSEELLFREMGSMYQMVALPGKRLTLSWPAFREGQGLRPSFLVERIALLCPLHRSVIEESLEGLFRLEAPLPALEQARRHPLVRETLAELPAWQEALARLEATQSWSRGQLEASGVEAVFGEKIPLSASRMEKLKTCHFQYFMEYGLGAKAREQVAFSPREYGTFVHFVLEQVMLGWKAQVDLGKDGLTPEEADLLVEEGVAEFGRKAFPWERSPRETYLFERMGRGVKAIARNALEELRASQFRPLALELGFLRRGGDLPPILWEAQGVALEISGLIDRVDGWIQGDTLYLRLVDYKTGKKGMDLGEVFYGRNLQLLIYLFALQTLGQEYFQAQTGAEEELEIKGAAVSYFPARDVVVKGSSVMGEEGYQKALDQELRRSGVVLNQEQVLEALEALEGKSYRFLPYRVSKEGLPTGKGLLSQEEFGLVDGHIQGLLGEICWELGQGMITADPYWQGEADQGCTYCPYPSACHFEEGRGGDRRRYLPKMSQDEMLAKLRKAQAKEGEDETGGTEP